MRPVKIECSVHFYRSPWVEDVTILAAGITVQIMATICDGTPECFEGVDGLPVDEWFCGFKKYETILIGKYHIVIMHFKIIYKTI